MRNIRLSFSASAIFGISVSSVLIRATMIAEEMTANAQRDRISCERSSYYKTNMSLLDYIILFSVTIFS